MDKVNIERLKEISKALNGLSACSVAMLRHFDNIRNMCDAAAGVPFEQVEYDTEYGRGYEDGIKDTKFRSEIAAEMDEPNLAMSVDVGSTPAGGIGEMAADELNKSQPEKIRETDGAKPADIGECMKVGHVCTDKCAEVEPSEKFILTPDHIAEWPLYFAGVIPNQLNADVCDAIMAWHKAFWLTYPFHACDGMLTLKLVAENLVNRFPDHLQLIGGPCKWEPTVMQIGQYGNVPDDWDGRDAGKVGD